MINKDIIVLLIIAVIIILSSAYIIKAKKRGQKCIGCPYSKECKGHCNDKYN